jgi:hypothetical protein
MIKTYKENPVMSKKRAISGNVTSNKFLLPNVSIVYTAGSANSQLTIHNRINLINLIRLSFSEDENTH